MTPVFAVSDVHGHRDDLVTGLRDCGLVREDSWCGADARLYVLGDLTDRGPDGIGVVDLVRSLQSQAPGQVEMLMGNHEILALGMARFPQSQFAESWWLNGGRNRDQESLTAEHLHWLAELPVLARVGRYLLMHSDTTAYLSWGHSVKDVNETVAAMLSDAGDLDAHWEVWAKLTSRYHFARRNGAATARGMLRTLGGDLIVHGHSIIGSLVGRPSAETAAPLSYADGLVLAIDGGRYDGGPLLVVRLE